MPLLQRGRRPRASSPSHDHQNRRPAELPEYEPLSCPLNRSALREIAELSTNNVDIRKYEELLKQSITLLTTTVGAINDRHVKRNEELKDLRKQRKARNQDGGEEADASRDEGELVDEAAFAVMREAVPKITKECDAAVRSVIDLRVELEDGRKAIQDTLRKVSNENGEDHDLAMGNAERRRRIQGPLHTWQYEKEKASADYDSRSLEERYSRDNDYIHFKRLWWDAVHSVDGKPLPDASRWFSSNNADGDEEEDEEDEDLVIAEEHLSILCPLTLKVMERPYTSSVCRHTFEKSAIEDFLPKQPQRKARCPQHGCDKELSINDFYDDPIMLRKIKRELEAQERQNNDDEEEEVDELEVDEDGDTSMMSRRSDKADRGRGRGNELLAGLGLDAGNGEGEYDDEDAI